MAPRTTQDLSPEAVASAQRIIDATRRQAAVEANRPDVYGHGERPPASSGSPGEAFVSSDAYRSWLESFPSGGPPDGGSFRSTPVRVRLPLGGPDAAMRALVSAADASAGTLVQPDRAPLEPGLFRPLTIRQLVTVIPTERDVVELPREKTRTSAAAPVAEATALTGSSGTKPEAGLDFEIVSVPIRTIAVWIAATRQIINDAPFLRTYIDDVLRQDIGEELEDQMLVGSGTGENFAGILNTTGIGTEAVGIAPETRLDALRRARRRVQVDGRTTPNAIVLHPNDAEEIDLIRVNNEQAHYVGPGPYGPVQRSVWGLPVIETSAMIEGTGLVGDFRKAILFDREDVAIAVGTVGDDFIRNIVRILAELRAGFIVAQPKAFCRVTGL